MNRSLMKPLITLAAVLAATACGTGEARELPVTNAFLASLDAPVATVVDTLLPTLLSADGVAAPLREATLSTKLMATVTAVLVQEGDLVRAGQLLVRLDARDIEAKTEQVAASVAAAEAMESQAAVHAARIRALFADSAAPKAMLEAAAASLAQATAGLRAARAAGAEVRAAGAYAEVRAPFAGRVTQRFVDPGAFGAPGAPLVSVQDVSALRISAHLTPDAARSLRRGQVLNALIEGEAAQATIEGLVPVIGSLYAVNAIVPNRAGAFLAGSAATLLLPAGTHQALAIPSDALRREGDLVGVTVRTDAGDTRRWIRIGASVGGLVEVTAGLRAGERVLRGQVVGEN
jgi:membrane fusion protein (multidrug efflux system)